MLRLSRFSSEAARFLAFVLILGGSALLAACDVASPTDDAGTLLDDARLARQGGDLSAAVRLLEQALALDPASDAVRVELSSAYLQQEDVDVLDIDRFVRYITGEAEPSAPIAGSPASRLGSACVYEDDPTAAPFDPRGEHDYPEIYAARDVLQDALALLHSPPDGELPVMPASLRAIDLCGAVVDGTLNYDRETALADLRATGLSDLEIASALAVNGAARFFDGYFFLVEDVPQQTAWYALADGGIGICAADEASLRVQSEQAVADLFEALVSLDLRAELLGGTSASADVLANAIAAYEALSVHLGPTCGA